MPPKRLEEPASAPAPAPLVSGYASSSSSDAEPEAATTAPEGRSGLPAELARELARSGLDVGDVTFVDVDGRDARGGPVVDESRSTQYARVRKVVAKGGVSRTERRRHQITAVAAAAAALAAEKDGVVRRSRKR